MAVLNIQEQDGSFRFDEASCKAVGAAHQQAYRSAEPFPHIVFDDFLDATILRRVAAQFPDRTGAVSFDRDQERLKYQYSPQLIESPMVRNLLSELNSEAFLAFVSALTGIEGLIPDPYFAGGGLHEIRRGGHLSVHADFNIHKIMKVERRLNLLIYLNDDWHPDYGGELELWDREMKAPQRKIAPLLGRAVLFNTSLDSYHGHPEPLACPEDRTRRSIALYYYTAFEEGLGRVPERTTVFRKRQGSKDRTDWAVMRTHLLNDWVPPRIRRMLKDR